MSIDKNPNCPFIQRFAEHLKLSSKSPKQRTYRPMTVSAEEFMRRLLQHVLPRGFQKVRHFGFMHQRSKVSPTWLAMLVTVTLNMTYTLIVGPEPGPPSKPKPLCPNCGGPLECLGFGQPAMLKLKTIVSGLTLIDSS